MNLEKRLMALESAKADTRLYEHLTDAELDERIAALKRELGVDNSLTNEGHEHAKP